MEKKKIHPRVSEHALLRYLERKYQIDVSVFRKLMMTDDVYKAIKAGAKMVRIDGIEFRVADDGMITTVIKR
ncbi:MAG: hypothetical protein ACK5PR_01085 [bacterium]|jgi:uncharacterized pyridoxal phosphate-containing UPF0001 family protein